MLGISGTDTNYTISVTANRVDQDCELTGYRRGIKQENFTYRTETINKRFLKVEKEF